MKERISILATISLLLLGALAGGVKADAGHLTYRWVMAGGDFNTDAGVAHFVDFMKKAKAAGYNGLLVGVGMTGAHGEDPVYLAHLKTVREAAEAVGMDLYPQLPGIGYSGSILDVDYNLAEGPPVRDALFVAHNGKAALKQDPASAFTNGDFERFQGDQPTGWNGLGAPGVSVFVDGTESHDGGHSIRMENFSSVDPKEKAINIGQVVPVQPYKQYLVSVWMKTKDADPAENSMWYGGMRIWVVGKKNGVAGWPKQQGYDNCDPHPSFGKQWRNLYWPAFSMKRDQDWTQYTLCFNSLESDQVRITIGAQAMNKGKMWFDDAKFEEVGLLNLLRRAGCPLVVKGEDGTVYKEGVDFNPVSDPPHGDYDVTHTPPVITLTAGSRIKEGEHLKVSYYHNYMAYSDSQTACLSDPKVFEIIGTSIKRLNDALHPKGYFLNHDEVREGNWCETCTSQHKTPGQLMCENENRIAAMVKKVDPNAKIFDWTDMFDPNHNAVDRYFMVNGTWAGSWKGLTKDLIFVNWNGSPKTRQWFTSLKYQQILSDGSPETIQKRLAEAGPSSGIVGVMFTVWDANFDKMAEYAKALWGGSK